jgi:hypothetical protein
MLPNPRKPAMATRVSETLNVFHSDDAEVETTVIQGITLDRNMRKSHDQDCHPQGETTTPKTAPTTTAPTTIIKAVGGPMLTIVTIVNVGYGCSIFSIASSSTMSIFASTMSKVPTIVGTRTI